MKTWIKLALMSVVAVMLAACGGQEKSLYHMRCSQIGFGWMCITERGELDPHNTVTAVYHLMEKETCLPIQDWTWTSGFRRKNENKFWN